MDQIKGTDKIEYADMVHIVFSEKCVKKFLWDEQCLNYTFDEVLKDARENGYTDGTILVVAENPQSGKIYRYGNYGDFWVEVGSTIGYA